MSAASRKAPAPPVLDYPPPGVFPGGGPPPPAPGPAGPAPPPQHMPHAAGGTWHPADPLRPPPSDLRVGQTALLAARVLDLLRANGLRLSGRLSGRLPAAPALSGSLRLPGGRRYWWAYSLVLAGVLALGVRLGGALAGALADPLTTLQYGDPRTTHLSVLFGLPGETSTSPSLVTATNDHGVGHIWLLPAGQAKLASVLEIPLFDTDPDGRLPLHLAVADLDRDGHPDLIVTPGDGPSLVYLLDTGKGALRPPTPDEQRRLVLPGH